MKVCEKCGVEIDTKDGENLCKDCDESEMLAFKARQKRNRKARLRRREIDDVMKSLGLVKVKGAMGGTYYE